MFDENPCSCTTLAKREWHFWHTISPRSKRKRIGDRLSHNCAHALMRPTINRLHVPILTRAHGQSSPMFSRKNWKARLSESWMTPVTSVNLENFSPFKSWLIQNPKLRLYEGFFRHDCIYTCTTPQRPLDTSPTIWRAVERSSGWSDFTMKAIKQLYRHFLRFTGTDN